MGFDHILMIGFGGPTRPEEVRPFLQQVTRGVKIPEERLREVEHHYQRTGGFSPYNEHALRLFDKLKGNLSTVGVNLPVFIGMRNWHPFLKETLGEIRQKGLKNGVGLVLAPHRSPASFEKYLQGLEEAKQEAQALDLRYDYLRPWYNHPLFIQAQADQIRKLIGGLDAGERAATHLLFTAHSIPLEMARRCRYEEEFRESSRLVAEELENPSWSVAYQSRSGDPRQPWLEPDLPAAMRQLKEEGKRRILLVPIGFIFDHTEVLYDLDVEAREEAEALGFEFARASTVMDHPTFIGMFAQLIKEETMGNECGSSGASSCSQPAGGTDKVKAITKEELKKKIQEGSVQVVNVLDPKWYELGIIEGSKKIPLKELDSRAKELDRSKEVVTYCASYECRASMEAAEKLAAKGFKVRAYEGGIKEWKEAGLPTEKTEKAGSGSSCCGG